MRILIAEDDFASRKFMLKFLIKYAEVDVTVDGQEAVNAFELALEDGEPYDLVCLDVMMPNMDGLEALETIRQIDEYRACGVNGIHLYALNKFDDVAYIAREAGLLDLI